MRIDSDGDVCDVTVDKNHNLFVRSKIGHAPILSHNCLDENTMFRKMAGFSKGEFYTLERMALEFGMNHYQHTKIGKGDRTRLRDLPIRDVAEYAATDVVLPIRLMRMQLALAKFRDGAFADRPYRRFFECVTQVGGRKLQQFCFHPDTWVATEHGSLKLIDVVREPCRVWSFNHDTGRRELRNVVVTSEHETPEDMMEITYEGGTVRVTASHELWCVNKNAYIKARDIEPSDELLGDAAWPKA